MVRATLFFLIAVTAGVTQDNEPLRGFTAESSVAQGNWEARFRALTSTENLRDYMKRLSARPHHVGSPYDTENADWILSKFNAWGFDAKIETFQVLFPTPKERALPENLRLTIYD